MCIGVYAVSILASTRSGTERARARDRSLESSLEFWATLAGTCSCRVAGKSTRAIGNDEFGLFHRIRISIARVYRRLLDAQACRPARANAVDVFPY